MNDMEIVKKLCEDKVKELGQLQRKVEKSLKKAPEGSLNLSESNGTVQYYHRTPETGRRGRYLKKKESKLIGALAQKDYDLRFYQELKRQSKQLEDMIKNVPDTELKDLPLSLPPARRKWIHPHILTDEEFVEEWLSVQYTGKNWEEEMPKIETERGEKVRSKSEKILADKLFSMGIPYRYEYPLEVDGFRVIYPDFTLLKVSERKEIYLEHFGMMDDPAYCQKTILKLQTYARNQIFPGKNLLMTFETLHTPLDMRCVEDMLREFLFNSYSISNEDIQRVVIK